jgi:hypothetical protein
MNKAKALAWFAEVEAKVPAFPNPSVRVGPRRVPLIDPYASEEEYDSTDHDAEEAADVRRTTAYLTFVMAAEQAIKRTFPSGDPVVRRWETTFPQGDSGATTRPTAVLAGITLFHEAHEILKSDRFDSLIEGVRAETVGELLDQADAMLATGWLAAAMVTAGGAVESTLRHLCEHVTPRIEIEGHGSIEGYNRAIGTRRKEGTEVLSANQSKMITAWGGLRNRAAHFPKEFSDESTKEGVRTAIDGIRQFLASVSPG